MARFYRVLNSLPPAREHFQSYWEMGRRPRPGASQRQIRSYSAVSAFDTEGSARHAASQYKLGSHIAILELSPGGPVEWEQSGRDAHHFDLRGTTDDLLAHVVDVVPV